MSRIYWDQSYSVHNDELDAQHKRWFDILNRLHDAMLNAGPDEYVREKADALKAMVDYTRFHFRAEEAFMRKINYPAMDSHVKLHERFVDQISEYYDDLQAGRVVLGTRIIKFMQEWLKDHIATEDKQYASLLH